MIYNITSSGFSYRSLINTLMGITLFVSVNFCIGSLLLLKHTQALWLGAIGALSGVFLLIRIFKKAKLKKTMP